MHSERLQMLKYNYILCLNRIQPQKTQYIVPARQAKGKPGSDAQQQAGGRLECPLSDMGQGLFFNFTPPAAVSVSALGKGGL